MKLFILFLIAFILILSFQSRVTSSQEDVSDKQAEFQDSFAAHFNHNRDKYKRKPKKVVTTKRSGITVSLSAKQKEEQKKMMTSTAKSISTTRKLTTTQKTTTKITTTEKPKVITWPPVKETLSADVIKALDFSLNLLVWEDRKIERFSTPEVTKLGALTMLRCLSDGQRKNMNSKMVDCQKQYKNNHRHNDNNAKEVEITDCFVHSITKKGTNDNKDHHASVLDKDLVKKEIDNTHVTDKNGVKQHFESCLNQYMKATRLNEFIDKKIPMIRQNANWDEIDKLFNNKTIEGKKDLNEAREDVFSQKGMACFLESLVKHGCVDEVSRKSTSNKP